MLYLAEYLVWGMDTNFRHTVLRPSFFIIFCAALFGSALPFDPHRHKSPIENYYLITKGVRRARDSISKLLIKCVMLKYNFVEADGNRRGGVLMIFSFAHKSVATIDYGVSNIVYLADVLRCNKNVKC